MTWEWRDEALHIHWFLTTEEQELLSNKTPHGRLGFAVLLKHFQNEGRFPEHFKDVPHVVLMYLANQIDVPRSSLEDYALDGRTAKRDRKEILTTHGQSEVGFAFCYLLGFDLMPRLKNMASQKLYLPEAGSAANYPELASILTRPINWELIRQQYDEMVKYTTALKAGTAQAESILARFTRNNVQHPTYRALAELGKAIKTIFLCQYINEASLRQEIHAGLNVVENWNSANSFIFYGDSSEITSNRQEDQELSVLSLHLLQLCLVYVNTLMIQQVLKERAWFEPMREADFRALTPLIYSHINPYGWFELDMDKRLPIDKLAA